MLNYCRIPNYLVPSSDRGVNDQGMTANTYIVGQGAEFLFHLVIEVKNCGKKNKKQNYSSHDEHSAHYH